MSDQQRGAYSRLNIAIENQFGVAPTSPAVAFFPFNTEDLKAERNQNTAETIDGTRNPNQPFSGNKSVAGSITAPVGHSSIGWLLFGVLGAPVTVDNGDGTYEHTFTLGVDAQPSFSIEKQLLDLDLFYVYTGIKISSLSFTVGGDGELLVTAALEGADELPSSATTYAGSEVNYSLDRFENFDASLKEGGSTIAHATEFSTEINANLDTDQYAIGGGGKRVALPEGKVELTGSLTTFFKDEILLNKAKSGTETSLELLFENGDHSLSIKYPQVEYSQTGPTISGSQGLVLALDYRAYHNAGNGSAIEVVLVNDVSQYTSIA